MSNLEHFFESETLIIELLVLVTIVAVVAQRLRMPYTVALVIAGLFVTSQSPVNIEITPELILGIFIPPLVFEAAFHVEFNVLRDNFTSILMLAVPGVIITTLIVGVIINLRNRYSHAGSNSIRRSYFRHRSCSCSGPLQNTRCFEKTCRDGRRRKFIQ